MERLRVLAPSPLEHTQSMLLGEVEQTYAQTQNRIMFVRLMEEGELEMLPHDLLNDKERATLPNYYGFQTLNSKKGVRDFVALSA